MVKDSTGARNRIRAFLRNAQGNVAMIFGLAVLPLLFAGGAAVDYARMTRGKSALQKAVDLATLAAAQNMTSGNTILQSNVRGAAVGNVTATFTQNADGSITGVATGQVPTTVMKLAHVDQMSVRATATAARTTNVPQTPSTTTFTLNFAEGFSWKRIRLYVHAPGAASDTLLAAYIYQPVDLSAVGPNGGGGTGTTTGKFLTNGAMVPGPIDTPVQLGSNYDKVYLTLTGYRDNCGPGMTPTTPRNATTTQVNCVASGTVIGGVTYTKTMEPEFFSTDDPATAHNLFIGGVSLPNNATPAISTILPCNQTVTHMWEDTNWANPLPNTWANQDISFSVQTSCAANNSLATTSAARLIQ